MISYEKNAVVNKTMQFSLLIIKYCEILNQEKKFIIANQLFKSSTSIGANVIESQHGESPADFLHKMKIASKEAHETFYWLKLCQISEGYKFDAKYLNDLEEIVRIISRIIITCKRNNS
jgi:four helix bundle protein